MVSTEHGRHIHSAIGPLVSLRPLLLCSDSPRSAWAPMDRSWSGWSQAHKDHSSDRRSIIITRTSNMQADDSEIKSHEDQSSTPTVAACSSRTAGHGQPPGRRSPRRPSPSPPNQPQLQQSIDFKSRAADDKAATPAAATSTRPVTRRPRFQCTPAVLCGSVGVHSDGQPGGAAALSVPAASREVRNLNYSWLMPSPMEDDPELESEMSVKRTQTLECTTGFDACSDSDPALLCRCHGASHCCWSGAALFVPASTC